MRKTALIALFILAVSIMGFAQKQKKSPDDLESLDQRKTATDDASRSANRANTKNTSGKSLSAGTMIDGQLQSTLDVKHAQVGDEVILKTTKTIKQGGETVIAKGSTLVGRVTEVQQRTKSNAESRLALVFDRVEGKSLNAPLNASIVSITNAAVTANVSDIAGVDAVGSSATSAGTRSSSGGLLGGVGSTVGGAVNGLGSTVGNVGNTATQTVGGVTNTVGQTAGSVAGNIGQTVNGIQISNSLNGAVRSGTTLTSANKNIRLEKGVNFQLQLNSSVQAN